MMFLSIWDEITTAIVKALRSMFLSLCELVYKFIIFFYEIFEKFGSAHLLRNDTVMEIYRRIGLIIGLVMIFRLIFSFIQYVINPDLISDKQKGLGNIIKNVIVVIVLLGITPTLFNEAYKLQDFLIKQNIVGKIITGRNYGADSMSDAGVELSWYAFSSFYRFSDYVYNSPEYDTNPDQVKHEACPTLSDSDDGGALGRDFKRKHTLRYAYNCINKMKDVDENDSEDGREYSYFVIDFDGNGIVPLITGILILWLIIMYTVQLGVRLLQLAYLELIAPIPIIMYLDPKNKDILSKWGKQCLTTFLDYFIRTGILYFIIFIIKLLVVNDGSSLFMEAFNALNLAPVGVAYVKIIMIIALLIFAKRVPKLLEEVFPSLKNAASLDFGLKIPKEMKQVGGAVAGAGLGVIGAGVSGISRYRSNRAAGNSVGKSMLGGVYGVGAGLFKGTKSGFTKKGVSGGWKNIQESNNKYNDLITSGGSTMGTVKARVGNALGESKGQQYTREINNNQIVIDAFNDIMKKAEGFSDVKTAKAEWEAAKLRMGSIHAPQISKPVEPIQFGNETQKELYKAELDLYNKEQESYNAAIAQAQSEINNAWSNYKNIRNSSVDRALKGDLESFGDLKDRAIAAQINVKRNDTQHFADSHNVFADKKDFSTTAGFGDASTNASLRQSEIMGNKDYASSLANDARVGNDSKKTSYKG